MNKKILRSEFIGKKAKIKNQNQTFNGLIVDETKNTITIKTKDEQKKIIKSSSIIEIDGIVIDGKKISKKPEERIKLSKR